MSKRKKEQTTTGTSGTLHPVLSAKKVKKELVEKTNGKKKEAETSEITSEVLQAENNNDVKIKNNNIPLGGQDISKDEITKNKNTLKRKREEQIDDEKEEPIKLTKVDTEVEDKKEDNHGGKKVKKIFKKRISKNECLCSPVENQPPLQKSSEDTDAHIQVEEWRLHKFQSPIELKHEESIHHDHFEPLEFHGHWDDGGEATFTNNGFTATLRFYNRELPILKGGPLHEDEFIFEQLHFHWSEDDHSGCEHIFEGRAYSMEAHAVHFNTKYKDFNEAHDKPDGLSVVAFFLQATDNEDNPCFNKLATAVKDIIKINTTTKVPSDCLTWFKEEAQCKGYYTYQGSLTTEPYTESVTWILYPQPIHVSREQVASFRSLKSTPCEQHNIKQNVRPIQTPPEHKKLNVLYARSHRQSSSD